MTPIVNASQAPRAPERQGARSHVGWLAGTAAILKEAGIRWSGDACYRMGASLAFYAIFSIFPLLLVAVTILGFFLGEDPSSRGKLIDSLAGFLSPDFRIVLDDALASMQMHQRARGVGAVVGALTLVFGASGVFSELETSFNVIWRVAPAPALGFGTTILRALEDKAIAFTSVAAAGAVLLTSLFLSTAVSALGDTAQQLLPSAVVWHGVEGLVSLGLVTLLFALVFRMLPRTYVAWRDVLGGALFTALVFSVLKHILAEYLGHIGSYAAYGAVGGVLGLLMWIYLVSLLVFFGAEITRVYAERRSALRLRAKAGPEGVSPETEPNA